MADVELKIASAPFTKQGHNMQHIVINPTESYLKDHQSTTSERSVQTRVFRYLRPFCSVIVAILYTALYVVIIFVYVRRRGVNGVINSPYSVDAKIISNLWFVLSIFVLDLGRMGAMGFEAASLTLNHLAPSTALKLMWHADKSWCTVVGLLRALTTAVTLIWWKVKGREFRASDYYPGRLWWTLLLINLPLWIAAPLSGSTFNLGPISTLTSNQLSIIGVNETTFDMRVWTVVLDAAINRWSQAAPASPKSPNIFYAPTDMHNVSQTFYQDSIESYQDGDWIAFFTAPEANSLLQGTAWGLKVNVSCRLVNPLTGLELVKVGALGNFSNITSGPVGYFKSGAIYGASSAILAASNFQPVHRADYAYSDTVAGTDEAPVHDGKLEIVVWQYYNTSDSSGADPTLQEMRNQSIVAVEPLAGQGTTEAANPDILAYGLSLDIRSSVGYAKLSAGSRTYSNFRWFGSSPVLTNENYGLDPDCLSCLSTGSTCDELRILQCQSQEQDHQQLIQTLSAGGIMVLENLILAGLTCQEVRMPAVPLACSSAWYAANLATGMKLYTYGPDHAVQAPAIGPERMRSALLKLVGELAVAMMGPGSEPFEGNLTGVRTIRGLNAGPISWKPILVLLCLWTVSITVSTILSLIKRSHIPLLDGYQFFRFGAEWGNEAKDIDEDEFQFCEKLQAIPHNEELGYIHGDGQYGFVGVTLRRRGRRSTQGCKVSTRAYLKGKV